MSQTITEDDLIREHMPRIRKIACKFARRCRCQADRDEVFSDALLGALQGLRSHTSSGGAVLTTYMITCAARRIIDGIRVRRAHKRTGDGHILPLAPGAAWEDPDISLDNREEVEHLTREMDPAALDLLGLVYWEDLTFREAGERLGVSESSAFRRHKNIVKQIRRRIERSEE